MSKLKISRAQRLDQRVIELLPSLSRARAAKLVEDGKVTVNRQTVTKPGQKLRAEDVVIVDCDAGEPEGIPDIDLPVLYEDGDCVVIDKPAGLLTHSKGAFNPEATVATWLRNRLQDVMQGERGGIVHRLDRATSGVMICAKNPNALSWLQKQFSTRKVKKTYYAVVPGHMPHDHAMIDMPIMRNPKKPQTFRAGSGGKPAVTEYWVRGQNDSLSLLELQPQTGRTHQLRVHLSTIAHPIVGDTLYGGSAAERLYLHAERLELTLPNRTRRSFEAALPGRFRAMIRA